MYRAAGSKTRPGYPDPQSAAVSNKEASFFCDVTCPLHFRPLDAYGVAATMVV